MKKWTKIVLGSLLIASMCLLGGCGGQKNSDVTVDTAAMAKELAENAVTSDTLTETASAMVGTIYNLSDDVLAGGSAYMSAGSTACEAAVLESKEASQTKDVESALETRVKNQSDLYASYNAGEVEKLDKAIIKSAGKYTVLVVCDDTDKAEEILNKYGF